MTDKLKNGTHVEWATTQGKTTGKVVRKITGTAKVKGHMAKATKAQPQYEVETEKSGKTAIHKPESLKPIDC